MCGLTAYLALKPARWNGTAANGIPGANGINGTNGTNGAIANGEVYTPNGVNGLGDADVSNISKQQRKLLMSQIDESLDIVNHRGPDARGQWISSNNRVDLSPAGNQPFHNDQDDVHAIVNGELYNHEAYREQLSRIYQFQGDSDCEIVLALYKQYGQSFLQHLRGEFALVLWDAKRRILISARDRFGIKSLYYTVQQGNLLVATEMKSFLAYGWQPEWDVQALRENGWRFDSRTMFKGVSKVLPGHYLVSKQYAQPEQKLYWDPEFPDKNELDPRTEEEIIEGAREKLLESVNLRLKADVSIGVYLSGGLDSSALAGMVAHLIKERGSSFGNDHSGDSSRLKCFCVQFDKDSGADESDIARRTAEWLGVDFITLHMDESAIAANFEATAWHSEAPNPDANGIGRLAMSKMVKDSGLKVVLTGEGADENFSGYTLFAPDYLMESDPAWPAHSCSDEDRNAGRVECSRKLDIFTLGELPQNTPQSTKRMLANTKIGASLCTHTPVPFESWTDIFASNDTETVLAESFNGRVYDKMINKWHPLHTSQYIWTRTVFPNILLRYLGDNVDMTSSIESRVPYLDHHVAEYANRVPPSLKMRYDPVTKTVREKSLLREAMKPFITEEIYNRPKHPYMGPVKYSADGPLYKVITKLVTEENVKRLGFVDWEKVKGLAEKAFVEHQHSAFRNVLSVAQFVVLSQRFSVKTARSGDYEL